MHMADTSEDLSLSFYDYLSTVIGTEDVVRRRRQIFIAFDDVNSFKGMTCISSGSKAEGLDLPGSDFDLMCVRNDLLVYEYPESVNNLPGTFYCVMETDNAKVGFAKLKSSNATVFTCTYLASIYELCLMESYLSSTLFRDFHGINIFKSHVTHGPCSSDRMGISDLVASLRCKSWISLAIPWLARTKYSWASEHILASIVQFGVLFVPVGIKNSKTTDLEWRISFSFAEKLLVWSFNHVQLFCYALMKIILRQVKKRTNTGDLLCSYFVKTIMFWVCEETEASLWKAGNLLSCYLICFKRLFYCVENKTCPHYFIPKNNLFENRFGNQNYKIIMSTLKELWDIGWTSLLHTEFLHSFNPSLSSPLPSLSFFPCLVFLQFFTELRGDFVTRIKRCVYHCLKSKKNYFYSYLLSFTSQIYVLDHYNPHDTGVCNNKQLYNRYRKRLFYFLIGLNHDAVNGWLCLATFYYVNKKYKICKKIIHFSLSLDLLEKNYVVWCQDQENPFNRMKSGRNTNVLTAFKKYSIGLIHFSYYSIIIPEEIKFLLSPDKLDLLILPDVYAHFLNFMCYHHLKNEEEKEVAFILLVYTIKETLISLGYVNGINTVLDFLKIAKSFM